MKQELKICVTQLNQLWEDKAGNFNHFNEMLAKVEGVDLIILPEMFATGFSMNASVLAEDMADSECLNWLKNLAAEKKAAIYTSYIVGENNHYFNRGIFVEPSGQIHTYDKRKTFSLAGETVVFTSGKEEVIVDYLGWKINLQICYDLRFPELVRNSIVDGLARYDLLLYVANWPERRIEHWKTLLKARAIENQCFVAGVNRVGMDNTGLSYSGDSNIINALGETMASIQANKESIEIISISLQDLVIVRRNLPFLNDL
jgi:omega-amidase